jgi:chromosome segregation ATPase
MPVRPAPAGAPAHKTAQAPKAATPPSKNLQNLEALLEESKAAVQERDAALERAAALEAELTQARERLAELEPVVARAGEIQEQLAAVMSERDRNAGALAEAQAEIEKLRPFPAQAVETQHKLEASERNRSKIAQEHAKLKSRLSLLEGQQKELIDRLKSAEVGRKKAETALANAKEMRNEFQYRLQAVQAVAQGDAPPARSRQKESEEAE